MMSGMDDLNERVTQLEIDTGIIRHDVANTRMSMTELENKIDKLQGTIFSVGMAIVGAIILGLLGIVAYFIMQKDGQLERAANTTRTEIVR